MRAGIAIAIAVVAFGAGAALWWMGRPGPLTTAPTISGAALYAATFQDAEGRAASLGQFQGKTLVLNFWATWCAPCREEMPAFARASKRWQQRDVAFVGISNEPPELIARFGRDLGVDYPLWSGPQQAGELAKRLGNRTGAIPFTALVDPAGRVIEVKVGPYTERELEDKLSSIASKSG